MRWNAEARDLTETKKTHAPPLAFFFLFFSNYPKRRGYGRALLECCETVARALGLPHLLLCSTDDRATRATWTALGFARSTEDQLRDAFGVKPGDLLHMDNTVQMHKRVPPLRIQRSVVLRHGSLVQRLYFEPFLSAGARGGKAAAEGPGGAAGAGAGAESNGTKRALPPPASHPAVEVKGEDGSDEAAAGPGSSTKRARYENVDGGGGGGGGGGRGSGAAAATTAVPPPPLR